MTEERDPILQTLFAEVQHEFDDKEFTARVLTRTKSLKLKIIAGSIATLLLVAVGAWLFALPVQELTVLIAQGLSIELVTLSNSMLSWILAPINNIAGVTVLSLKAMRMFWTKFRSASYA